MLRYSLILGLLLPVTAWAETELSEDEQAALAVVTPMVLQQTPEEQGKLLSQCIVESARKKEIATLAQADADNPDNDAVAVVQDIIQRKKVTRCFTKKVGAQ